MKFFKSLSKASSTLLIASLLLPTPGNTIEFSSSVEIVIEERDPWKNMQQGHLVSYDSVIDVLKKVESDEWEDTCTQEELEKTVQLLSLLGRQGILPGETDEAELEEDIYELLDSTSGSYSYAAYYGNAYGITPSIYRYDEKGSALLCGGWLKKKFHQTKKFVKKHKKELIIGAAVVVAVVVVVGVAAAVAGGAGAAAAKEASPKKKDSKPEKAPPKEAPKENSAPPKPTPSSQPLEISLQKEIKTFKELTAKENLTTPKDFTFPQEENGRALGEALTHHMLNNTVPNSPSCHEVANMAFRSSDSHRSYSPEAPNMDLVTELHQIRGERALELQHYTQAIVDFGKVIENTPDPKHAYLERASAHLQQGDYANSLKDYQTHIATKELPRTQAIDFSYGFAKGIVKGAKESGAELVSLASNLVTHPINTGREIFEACSLLCGLAHEKDWEALRKVIAPEVCELITHWDTLSSKERGELAGQTFGKIGSDILIPGSSIKAITSGTKGAKNLLKATRSFQSAKKTLALEALAESATHPQSFAEAAAYIRSAESAVLPMEEASSIGKAGIALSDEAKAASIAKYKNAEEFLKPYQKEYLSEGRARELIHQAGIQTFPRPKGIPENYLVKIADRSGGMKYTHPENPGSCIRVMPGKPHSPFLHQQKPYVICTKNGHYLDKFGSIVTRDSPQAHIPLDEFTYIGN